LLRKLMRWSNLDAADQQAVLDLPHEQRRLDRGSYIVREGDKPSHAALLLSGFAYRHKIVGNGGPGGGRYCRCM
jgi:CRP-like cAMP-binding protein